MVEAMATIAGIGVIIVAASQVGTNIQKSDAKHERKVRMTESATGLVAQVADTLQETLPGKCQGSDTAELFPKTALDSNPKKIARVWDMDGYEGKLNRCKSPRLSGADGSYYFCVLVEDSAKAEEKAKLLAGAKDEAEKLIYLDPMYAVDYVVEFAVQVENPIDGAAMGCSSMDQSYSLSMLHTSHWLAKLNNIQKVVSAHGSYYEYIKN